MNSKNIFRILKKFQVTEGDSAQGRILKISGVGKKDVYNPALLKVNGKIYLAGRVESRKSALDSQILFFEKNKKEIWLPIKESPVFNLEDPFFAKIGDEIIFGGVETKWREKSTKNDKPLLVGFKTVFYKGKDIYKLERFAEGPWNMKDIRIVELFDKKIGVFSRPQNGVTEKGKIGFIIINSLDELRPVVIQEAPLLENNFVADEWGGVNAAYLLDFDKIGVLGHIARQSIDSSLHYYAITFIFDYKTCKSSSVKIIATRDNFPSTEAKTSTSYDVIFPGALFPVTDDRVLLYAGLSDTSVGCLELPNPFCTYFKQ